MPRLNCLLKCVVRRVTSGPAVPYRLSVAHGDLVTPALTSGNLNSRLTSAAPVFQRDPRLAGPLPYS